MTAQTPKRLLFVCVENANRSQMAEAFARIHGGLPTGYSRGRIFTFVDTFNTRWAKTKLKSLGGRLARKLRKY